MRRTYLLSDYRRQKNVSKLRVDEKRLGLQTSRQPKYERSLNYDQLATTQLSFLVCSNCS